MHITIHRMKWARALRIVGTGALALALVLFVAGCGGAGSNTGGGGDDGGGDDGDGQDTTAPAAPSGLSADASDGAVGLTWDGVDDADTYSVYRGTSAGGVAEGSALETGVSGTSYEDPEAENGTTYYYAVTAVDAAGNESDPSSEATGTPFAPPSGLEGASGDSQIDLQWSSAAGAETYNVYRDTESMDGAEGDPLESGLSSSTYTDTSAENGTKYYYRVTSVNPEGEESPASGEVGKTPFSDPPDRPN